jgi:hypothetical protein
MHHGGKVTVTELNPSILIYVQNFIFLSFAECTYNDIMEGALKVEF